MQVKTSRCLVQLPKKFSPSLYIVRHLLCSGCRDRPPAIDGGLDQGRHIQAMYVFTCVWCDSLHVSV